MSTNKNLFTKVQMTRPDANTFDLTHDVKMTGKMGNLMPVLTQECVPGDKFKIGVDTLLRFAPLIAPVMHRMDVSIHYFFVPNRLLWPGWENFITNTDPEELPYYRIDGTQTTEQMNFLDYMGIPPWDSSSGAAEPVNALPFAAYQMIYNDYYRDENLITPVNFELTSGNNSTNSELLTLRKRAWEHDYFTSGLPWAQKGDAVDIPLGEIQLDPNWGTTDTPHFEDSAGVLSAGNLDMNGSGEINVGGVGPKQAYDPDGSLITQATTINDLRRAFRLQEFLEKNARGGTRYIENILAQFGVHSSDKRLNRPEYITGTKAPVIVSEVLNTTGESAGLPQGNMAGHAVSVNEGQKGSYYCEEHGFIIGIMSVTPKSAYMDGIPKHFLKSDYLDYYWPPFAHIGEQPILNKEIKAFQPTGDETFAYTPRYAEYKYNPSRVQGLFRTTLNYWTLGRKFDSLPTLSQDFVEIDPDDVNQIFAVQADEDNLMIHVLNKIEARRLMPYFGNPTI